MIIFYFKLSINVSTFKNDCLQKNVNISTNKYQLESQITLHIIQQREWN